jgi:WD40 repeat protein
MLWNLHTGARPQQGDRRYDVHDVAFSPDGRIPASAVRDGTVKLWNLDRGGPVKSKTQAATPAR